jgi:hypothetical protein
MHKLLGTLLFFGFCTATQAEWFQVKSVTSYNQIIACKPNAPTNEIKIRIKNLENIEDIQVNRAKVLFSGISASELAKNILAGQLVWIENLTEDNGIYVGYVYPSYEQVVRGYAKQKMVGGQTISPEIKSAVETIYSKMMRNLDSTPAFDNNDLFLKANELAAQGKSIFSYDICYQFDYLKGIFVYEALVWFKNTGQFLPNEIQKLYISWLAQYQNAQDQRAQALEQKIRDMTVRYELYKDFIFDD